MSVATMRRTPRARLEVGQEGLGGDVRADAVFSCYILLGVDVNFGEDDAAGGSF